MTLILPLNFCAARLASWMAQQNKYNVSASVVAIIHMYTVPMKANERNRLCVCVCVCVWTSFMTLILPPNCCAALLASLMAEQNKYK
jgi:hypothetical protein